MPIYEYVCQSCQHRFEVKQGISDPPLSNCIRCGQAVTKVISPPAIMFKGTGWYITDYSDKLKPGPESKTDEKTPTAAQKNGDSSAGTAAPASSAPAASPPAGNIGSPPAAAATPSVPSTK